MRVLFDANVLLSFVTDRNAEQARGAGALFESARDGKLLLLLHHHVASETAFVMLKKYERPAAEVNEMLSTLIHSGYVEPAVGLDWARLLDLWPAAVPDWGDASLVAAVKESHADSVATFDRAFARRLRKLGVATYWN